MLISKFKKQIHIFLAHPLLSGSLIMVGGSTFVNGINYFYHLLMGRLLQPSGYGVLSSLFSILYILSIVPSSASFAIVKFVSSAKTKEERWGIYKEVYQLTFRLSIGIAILLLLFSSYIQNFLHIDDFVSVLLIAPMVVVFLLTIANQAVLQGVLNFSSVVLTNFTQNAVKLVLGVVAVLIGFKVAGAMAAVLIGSFLGYLISRKAVLKLETPSAPDVFSLKLFLKFALPVLLQAFAFTSYFTTDVILVKHYLSAEDAGLYAALSMLGKIIYFAAQPITQVMFPIISGKRSRGEHYRKVFYLAFTITLSLSLGMVLAYYLFSDLAIRLMYGSGYLSVKNELVWMALFMAIYTASYLLANFLLSIGRTKAVIMPVIIAFVQAVGIAMWHKDMLQAIQVSLVSMVILFITLLAYMGYNEGKRIYGKSR